MVNIKTINNPSAEKLAWCLVGIPLIAVVALVFKLSFNWVWIIGGGCVGIYLILMTYFCIKQKCYRQLLICYVIVIVGILTLWLQNSI